VIRYGVNADARPVKDLQRLAVPRHLHAQVALVRKLPAQFDSLFAVSYRAWPEDAPYLGKEAFKAKIEGQGVCAR
jgi:hypothetical protein